MKHFVTADEIRQLAASGERELMLREHTVLTDAAVDAVRLHGIRVVEGSTYSTSEPRPEVACTTTSSSVFHSPQPAHWPDHASASWPQSRQTYLDRALAIDVDTSNPAGRDLAPSPGGDTPPDAG